MATIRILVTVCAAIFAGLTLTLGSTGLAPAAAQTAAQAPPGRPLNLLPQLGKAKKFSKQAKPARVAKARTPARAFHRTALRRAAPARAFASRQSDESVPSRQDDRSVTPDQDSLGYQAESKVQPPIDAWLRSPLPAAAPATARPRAAARDRIDTTAETVTLGVPAAETVAADTATVDLTTADTVQVADAGEINEIDLAADQTPAFAASETPAPANKSWLNSLLAVLGGAFAAAAAASFLFARRRQIDLRPSY
jgi:hypothetical protein